MSLPNGLPQVWTGTEVCDALRISRRRLLELVSSKRVGCIVGKNRQRFYLPEHIAQIRDAIEVKPRSVDLNPTDDLALIGLTPRSAAIARRKRLHSDG